MAASPASSTSRSISTSRQSGSRRPETARIGGIRQQRLRPPLWVECAVALLTPHGEERGTRVSNHKATDGPASFETPAAQAPQDEDCLSSVGLLRPPDFLAQRF